MPLTTGTALQNPSDVIDAVRAHLAADGWTTTVNEGTVGSNDKVVVMHLPQVNTFYNEFNLTIWMEAGGAGNLNFTGSFYTPTEALITPPGSPATRNAFNRFLGQPNLSYGLATAGLSRIPGNIGDVLPTGQVLAATQNGAHVPTNGMSQGGNYLRHWIFTNDASPINAEQVYCYCVVEVATGSFRTFGFGEGIKLGAAGWVGGMFMDGTAIRAGSTTRSRWFGAADTGYNQFGDAGERAYVLNFNSNNLLNDLSSPAVWNPWMHLSDPGNTDWVTAWGPGTRNGWSRPYSDRGTAAFSGQTIRTPSRLYGMNVRQGAGDNRFRPLIEYPHVFHMNIQNFTPGEVITDDAETFLVVPYVSKTGTDNSGNHGFLIRNPNL
jgi:hypothetical protein